MASNDIRTLPEAVLQVGGIRQYKTSEQPIHAIEAPSYIIIFAILLFPHSKLDIGIIFQIESADC